MDGLKHIEIDTSWVIEYDNYLRHFSLEHKTFKEKLDLASYKQMPVSDAHTLILTNVYHVIKSKRPVQNIYKRPI